MSSAPVFPIDPIRFGQDPYPVLADMRATAPAVFVPELGATLFTRRDDIFELEKRTDIFRSDQPGGLMNVLMGQNMMRKDGDAHSAERRATFPAFSPRTVRDHWMQAFDHAVAEVLATFGPSGSCDLVADYAMPIAGHALRHITGLTNMSWQEMDRVSQGMIDGISNYAGDPEIEERCHDCTASIDAHITAMKPELAENPNPSLLSIQMQAGLSDAQISANVKLAISGGQNEPRDVIAGAIWALLAHPDQLEQVQNGTADFQQVFNEYTRWMSPIGMSPRQIGQATHVKGIDFDAGERVFFMFGAANRDPAAFPDPDRFDVTRDTSKSMAFGAGPHFCAGAAASKALIADLALPQAFSHFPKLRLLEDVTFQGWAFRGPVSVPVAWG